MESPNFALNALVTQSLELTQKGIARGAQEMLKVLLKAPHNLFVYLNYHKISKSFPENER